MLVRDDLIHHPGVLALQKVIRYAEMSSKVRAVTAYWVSENLDGWPGVTTRGSELTTIGSTICCMG